jgi:PleD family two-component response regulator
MLDAAIIHRNAARPTVNAGRPTIGRKVVVVNGSRTVLELLETVFEAAPYDVVFVESNERAYSQVRRVLPDLVILCVRNDDLEGFQILSMLKLDEGTRGIPVLTYTMDADREEPDTDAPDPLEVQILGTRAAEVMH